MSDSALDNVLEFGANQGVVDFINVTAGAEYLQLPHDITAITSKELGRYLNAFTQQKMYIRSILSWQEIVALEAKKNLDFEFDRCYCSGAYDRMGTEKEKTRNIMELPSMQTLKDALFYEDSRLRYVKANLASIEDGIFLLSREVSRRGEDFKDESREHNVGKNTRK